MLNSFLFHWYWCVWTDVYAAVLFDNRCTQEHIIRIVSAWLLKAGVRLERNLNALYDGLPNETRLVRDTIGFVGRLTVHFDELK